MRGSSRITVRAALRETVLGIALRAAAQSISVSAACRDLAKAPSDHAVLTALEEGLSKTLPVLERRLNEALTGNLPRRTHRRAWHVAIDWHLIPYYGQPCRSRNELCRSQPKQGTAQFHAYASACIVEYRTFGGMSERRKSTPEYQTFHRGNVRSVCIIMTWYGFQADNV